MYINAEEYMQEIWRISLSIKNKRRELAALDDTIGASAIQYKPDRVQTTPRQDGLERLAINHLHQREQLEARIIESITRLMLMRDEAVDYINKINSREQQEVLMLRYIEGLTWSEILGKRGRDDLSAQYQLHKRAIESLQKVMQNTTPELFK